MGRAAEVVEQGAAVGEVAVVEAAAFVLMLEAEAGAVAGSELEAVGHCERWTGWLVKDHLGASAQQD